LTYVTKSDGTTSDVDLVVVKTENLFCCDTDDRECLVELPQVDILLLETGGLEDFGYGECRSGREVHGVTCGVCVG
jgi:hypothetical protein